MNVFGKGMMPVKLYLFALVLCGLVAYGRSQGCTCEAEDQTTEVVDCRSNNNNPTRECCITGSIVSVVLTNEISNAKCFEGSTFFPSVGARCFLVTDGCKGEFTVTYCPDGSNDEDQGGDDGSDEGGDSK